MQQNWKNALEKGGLACTLFMYLSNAFDTINHNLLLVKLKAYGFSEDALTLKCSYLKNRKQRVVINNNTSTAKAIIVGAPQGSVDGLLQFSIFTNYLISFMQYPILGNYTDDNKI